MIFFFRSDTQTDEKVIFFGAGFFMSVYDLLQVNLFTSRRKYQNRTESEIIECAPLTSYLCR